MSNNSIHTPCFLCPSCWQVVKARERWFSTESTPIIQPVRKVATEGAVVCIFKYDARFIHQLIQDEEGWKRTLYSQISIKVSLKMNEEHFSIMVKTKLKYAKYYAIPRIFTPVDQLKA